MNKNDTKLHNVLKRFVFLMLLAGVLITSGYVLSGCGPKPKEGADSGTEMPESETSTMDASESVNEVDQSADKILKEMSEYLTSMKEFSYKSKGMFEVVEENNKQKLDYNAEVFVKRPNKLRVNVQNNKRDASVFYDGKTFSVLGKAANMYAQAPAPPTLDAALDSAREKFLLDPPGSDILYSNPYKGWMEEVTQGRVLEDETVNGKASHHLAFKAKEVDWEIWIQKGTEPLPLRYKIISKNEPQNPEFTVEFTDWKKGSGTEFSDQQFVLVPPAKAKKIPFMTLGEVKKEINGKTKSNK